MAEHPIAALLRLIREHRGISERALASELGVSPNALNTWARGLRVPEPPHVWRIAELAGLSVEEAMRIAGHLPSQDERQERTPRASESIVAAIASQLDDDHIDILVEISHALRRRQDRNSQE